MCVYGGGCVVLIKGALWSFKVHFEFIRPNLTHLGKERCVVIIPF